MKTLSNWTLLSTTQTGVELEAEGKHLLRISVLESSLFRVSLLKNKEWRLDRGWTVAPGGEAPLEGRHRDSLAGFPCPSFEVEVGEQLRLQTDSIRLTISQPLHFCWECRIGGEWREFAQDRTTGGFMAGVRDHRHAHFLARSPEEKVFGLGEKTGLLERSGRRYEMRNLDAMGYDAETTDPLYKHIPFTLTRTETAGCWSIFYDNLAGTWFDLGNELDNYHKPYRSYRAEDGDLDYYMRWAPELGELATEQAKLTGGTAFPPRWTLGYSGSTMSYTDAPDAQAQLEGFLDHLAEHDIPCDSFQLSSGYTSIGDKRYVFNWNTEKVPDVHAMTEKFHDAGVHLIANIKPCLLQDHPRYEEVAQAGLFVSDSEAEQPERSLFWDDEGSHLDFTKMETIGWWRDNVTRELLEKGIGSTWNDNNEYEIWDDGARCHGFGSEIPVNLIRPVQPILMTRASEEAQRRHAPEKRPYLISRSGAPGLQRYAQTWTGDNRTSWETLRWNIRMGLGLSLSGFFNIGHDVGGFSGPKPDPELFVRWVQNGIFHPRFTIHSWNDDQTVNEPWMYPEVTDHIRTAIKLRYRLIPYLYTLLWRSSAFNEPIIRPTFLEFPGDENCWLDTDDFMLGRELLIANVVEPGASSRAVRLPEHPSGWWDFFQGTWHAGGTVIETPVDIGTIPVFVKAGAIIPLGIGANRANPRAETGREIALFPVLSSGSSEGELYEDDGVGVDAPYSHLCFSLSSTDDKLSLNWTQNGTERPFHKKALLTLPASETRPIWIRDQEQSAPVMANLVDDSGNS
ncbi:TIM-barrel domain-containing protein [uncultured Roseibium sp.]|uniref:glycoside hydrolase family 31 protein n=1 Tax=uncultured Roseibium sp. TaxID=1936171 RepID=UPI0025931BAD|nr:TIM-barrel domain-containing protein [uncultured Roseibium sp.]